MKLYEIAVEGQLLESLLEETRGELTPEMEARNDHFLAAGKEKIEAPLCVRQRLEREAEVCRLESERLRKRATSLENQRAKLNERVQMAIDFGFQGRIKTARFSAWVQNSVQSYVYSMAPDADLVKFSEQHPDLVRVVHELNKSELNDRVKKGGGEPPEIVVEPQPLTRFLQVRRPGKSGRDPVTRLVAAKTSS